ncbi:MAG TPA: hypothetical protein VFY16_00575 [Gemmatimonadaceae bacterium]|nr:hypothetical protein [Gemmatimonadaceae bacterium]
MRQVSFAFVFSAALMGCVTAAPLSAANGAQQDEAPVVTSVVDSARLRADSLQGKLEIVQGQYDVIRRSLRDYEQIERDMQALGLLDDGAERGRLQAYFDGPELRKVIATRFDERGYSIHEVAYWGGTPFVMIFTRVSRAEREGAPARRSEDYFFLSPEGELLRWFGAGTREQGADRARRMQRLASEYSAALVYEQPPGR